MKYIIVSFVLVAILAASILKVLNYIDWGWLLISSPILFWFTYKLLASILLVFLCFKIKSKKRDIPVRKSSGFAKRLEEAQQKQREELEKRRQK